MLAVLDAIAATDVQPQDPSAPQELEHALPQQATSLAASMRELADKRVDESLQLIHAQMADTQQAFDIALQEHRFIDAAETVEQFRREVSGAVPDGMISFTATPEQERPTRIPEATKS